MAKRHESKSDKVINLAEATERHQDAVRKQVLHIVEDEKGMSRRRVAKEVGLTQPVISSWLNRKYKGDNAAVTAKVERWLRHRQASNQMEARLPEPPEWVPTATGERILNALVWAQAAGDLVITYGSAGVGKTAALRHYSEMHPQVWLVVASPATRSLYACMREVADAVGLRGLAGSGNRLYREVVHQVEGTRGLLIVDEAQHLSVEALEALRSLHDATGIGLALAGNEVVYARLTGGGARSVGFAQLFSRVGRALRFRRPRKDDVVALAEAWGVREAGAVRMLVDIAGRPGALRGVTKTLRLASMLALGEQRKLTAGHIEAAWIELGGEAANAA